ARPGAAAAGLSLSQADHRPDSDHLPEVNQRPGRLPSARPDTRTDAPGAPGVVASDGTGIAGDTGDTGESTPSIELEYRRTDGHLRWGRRFR
ncbi:hypothetical protein, partial [Frankia sp. CcWB2]